MEATWRINPPAASFQTVDVTLRSLTGNPTNQHATPANANRPYRFLLDCIQLLSKSPRSIKFVLPTADGFVGRLNFFERRLLECDSVERVEGFLALDQRTRVDSPPSGGLHSLVSSAAAGILLQPSDNGSDAQRLESVEAELASRLALNWILPTPALHRNVVLIEGYSYLQTGMLAAIVSSASHPHHFRAWIHTGRKGLQRVGDRPRHWSASRAQTLAAESREWPRILRRLHLH